MFSLFIKNAMRKLNISKLSTNIQSKAFINGSWISNSEGLTFDVNNPATGEKISEIPDLSIKETEYAIESAYQAFTDWSNSTALNRSNLLKNMNELLLKNEDDISYLITTENGKCLEESKIEVKYAASFLAWFAEEPRRIMGCIMPPSKLDRKLIILKQPIGPVGIITPTFNQIPKRNNFGCPLMSYKRGSMEIFTIYSSSRNPQGGKSIKWNFPLAMVIRKLGAILASGCTAVIKPAEDTPLTLLKFVEIIEHLIPPGLINVVTASKENSAIVGRVMCTDTRIKAITFTGSSEVGKILYSQSANSMKRLSFELGGNAPVLIFESANLDIAIKGVLTSKFRNSGQACISANRIFVHESIHEEFVKKIVVESKKLKLGNGLDQTVNQGPLINQNAVRKVEQLINGSVQLGARLQSGGRRAVLEKYPNGNFFEPTVITDCNNDHPLFKNEIFGPVCAINKFSEESAVIRMANSLNTGLAAYLFSEDHKQIWRVSHQLEMGIVGVNEGSISCCEAPFSGWKESGLGCESGIFGIEEYLMKKYICWGNLN